MRFSAICLLLLCPSILFGQAHSHYCFKAKQLIRQVERYHVSPRAVDDSLSADLFKSFLFELDPRNYLFNQADIGKWQAYQYTLDDQIKDQNCTFLKEVITRYEHGLKLADSVIEANNDLPMDLNLAVDLPFPNDEIIPLNQQEIEQKWITLLRYRSLTAFYQRQDQAENSMMQSQEKAAKQMHCRIQQTLEVEEGLGYYVGKKFLKSLAQLYDPHTAFFSTTGRQVFENSLSTEGFTFGFEVSENDQKDWEITSMVPGGPAWQSNQLNEGDIILEIKLANDRQVDLSCSSSYEVTRLLAQDSEQQVYLKVRKQSGQIKEVMLVKAKMAVQDNIVTSYILAGKKKIGYIYLPGFYTDMESEMAAGLTNDVSKELLKLQLEGIEGLILDLRHNGGGAIVEAMDLAGIFINLGPIAMAKDAEGNIDLLKDFNRGVAYDGPLAILVDGLSASASEIFAAAMQDYNRAVIVGDTTYGKSSGQQFVPISELRPQSAGDLKITMRQFYRVTGNSYQHLGVVPDVVLPQLWKAYVPHESDDAFALQNDQVEKKPAYQALPALPLAKLAVRSKLRLEKDSQFQQLMRASDSLLQDLSVRDQIPLSLAAYSTYRKRDEAELARLDRLEIREATSFVARNNKFSTSLSLGEAQRISQESYLAEIQNDMYIEETYRIVIDLIEHQ